MFGSYIKRERNKNQKYRRFRRLAKEGWGFDRDTQLTVIYLSRTLTILYGKGWEAGNLTSVAAGDLRLYGGTGVGDLNNSPRNDGQAKTFQVILPVYC